MLLDIQALNFPLTKAIHNYIERRLGFVLSSRDEYIQCVVVRLSDINGIRGSNNDKCCRIQVVLSQLSDVVIEDTESDLYTAIDRAADRSGRTIGRRLEQHHDRLRY